MTLPAAVLAFKLLDASKIPNRDRQLVLTGVNYTERDTLFEQMKTSLKKFHGEQSTSLSSSSHGTESNIKIEPKSDDSYCTSYSRGYPGNYYRHDRSFRNRSNYRSNYRGNRGNFRSRVKVLTRKDTLIQLAQMVNP